MRLKQSGFFLIELMIVIIFSLLLIHFILEIYQTTIKTDNLQTRLRLMQTNSNMTSAVLYSEIQRAGYMGYAHLVPEFPIISWYHYSLSLHNRINGNDKEIIIRKMEEPVATLLQDSRDGFSLIVSNNFLFSQNDIIMIADHWHAEIFKIKHIINKKNYQIIFPTQSLKQRFNKQAEIGKFIISKIFVAKTTRKNSLGEPIYALYKSLLKENNTFSKKIELIEGVHDIYFQYSVKRDNRLIDLSAKEISDWSQVVGVAVIFNIGQPRFYKTRYLYVALEK